MKWYEKFKVGQKVKVVKKISFWRYYDRRTDWVDDMNQTINKIYKIIEIDKYIGCKLHTQIFNKYSSTKCDYWYPVEALQALIGQQLMLFEL